MAAHVQQCQAATWETRRIGGVDTQSKRTANILLVSVVLMVLVGEAAASGRTEYQTRRDGSSTSWSNILFNAGGEGVTAYSTSHPTPSTTAMQTQHPACFEKKASLLGSFCVAPTTKEEDNDPEHKLPRITFQVTKSKDSGPLTIFLFDDEANSWPQFWAKILQNRTCDEITPAAKAVITHQGDGTPSYKNIMGKKPHNWYLVAVDCQTRECPKIDYANMTFFHPNSDGSSDFCTGLPLPAVALKNAVLEGWNAMRLQNILQVAGLSPFGVFILYLEFAMMLLFSFVFLIWGVRAESAKRFLYFNTFFVTSISCMGYLAMATGNGLLVLRKLEEEGMAASWHLNTPSNDLDNQAMLGDQYAALKTYPLFLARYIMQLCSSPLLLLDLFLITGVGVSTRAFMLFSNTMMILCWLIGSLITGPSRWGFWIFGVLFLLGVFIPMVGVLPTAAARKGRSSRRLYGRLMCVTLIVIALYPWAWVLVDGAHALPSDLAVLLYGVLDFLGQCVFGVILLRKVPALAEWGDELQGGKAGMGGGNAEYEDEEVDMGPGREVDRSQEQMESSKPTYTEGSRPIYMEGNSPVRMSIPV